MRVTFVTLVATANAGWAGEPWWEHSTGPSLDAAGDVVAFSSRHPIDARDMGADYDLFIQRIRG